MVRDGHGDGAGVGPLLDHDVAGPPSNLAEACAGRIWYTARPDRARSLPMRSFESRHEDFGMKALVDLLRRG